MVGASESEVASEHAESDDPVEVESDGDECVEEPAAVGERPCWVGCGDEIGTINISAGAKAGCFIGPNCYAALRGFKLQCKEAGCLKQMNQMKKKDPDNFKKRLLTMRIVDKNMLECGGVGCSNKDEQTKVMDMFIKSTLTYTTVMEVEQIVWLLKHQYKARMVYTEGLAANLVDAEKLWSEGLGNPDICRRGEGDNVRLAVLGIPSTDHHAGTTMVSHHKIYIEKHTHI
jgi:hypothetical protein